MQPVEFTLAVDHRGWARIQVRPPYGLFGDFLSSIGTPSRIQALWQMLAEYRADPTRYAHYAHDYHELEFEPSDGAARIVIDHPDQPRESEMPVAEFVHLAEQWLAFAEVHPVTAPTKQPGRAAPAGD
jgi:hypothetical protein